jgi:hypothetical protein
MEFEAAAALNTSIPSNNLAGSPAHQLQTSAPTSREVNNSERAEDKAVGSTTKPAVTSKSMTPDAKDSQRLQNKQSGFFGDGFFDAIKSISSTLGINSNDDNLQQKAQIPGGWNPPSQAATVSQQNSRTDVPAPPKIPEPPKISP